MKKSYFTKPFVLFIMLLCGAVIFPSTSAIAQKMEKSRLRVYFQKLSNNDKKISVILIKGKGKDMVGVENAEVFLSTFKDEQEVPLTSLFTDENGEADLFVEANYVFPIDEDGVVTINAVYNGNDSVKGSDKDVTFKDLHLDVAFDVIDSVKTITVTAFELDSTGVRTPISEIGMKVGVERLHSILYLEEIETDEEGVAQMHFPDDIPGDGKGNIQIVVKVEEDKIYGTVTKSKVSDWGLVVDFSETSNGRTLYGDEAPMWMTISVFVVLIGAWFHFLFAIYKVYRMAKTTSKFY